MGKTEWISIIVPYYNLWERLHDAIDSVVRNVSDLIYEIIIINDASTDANTTNILEKHTDVPNIQIINLPKNLWVQNVRTIWLEKAKHDYILMLDWDDCLNLNKDVLKYGGYIKNSMNILHEDQSIALVHCLSMMFGDYNWYTISSYPITEELVFKKHHAPTFSIYRREDALDVQSWMYNDSIKKWQDWSAVVWLFNSRFEKWKKNNVWFLNHPYFLYRTHNTKSRISNSDYSEKEMVKRTVSLYPGLFNHYYKGFSENRIVDTVYASKPDKLTDLLYVASLNNLSLALKIVSERGRILSWSPMNMTDLLRIASIEWVEEALNTVKITGCYIQSNCDLWNIP